MTPQRLTKDRERLIREGFCFDSDRDCEMTQERGCKHKFSCLDCGAMLPKDPDLLAVVAAAREWRDAKDVPYKIPDGREYWDRMDKAEQALRSALANLKLEEGS